MKYLLQICYITVYVKNSMLTIQIFLSPPTTLDYKPANKEIHFICISVLFLILKEKKSHFSFLSLSCHFVKFVS